MNGLSKLSKIINLDPSNMDKKIIKCSQCEQEFETGFDYRMHWETHLDDYLKKVKKEGETYKS